MTPPAINAPRPLPQPLFRHSRLDAIPLALSFAHGAGLLLLLSNLEAGSTSHLDPVMISMSSILIALGLWWNSNTISHNHLHNPLFSSSRQNRWFSVYLTVLLGIPQTLWRKRHFQHHHGHRISSRGSLRDPRTRLEILLVGAVFFALLLIAPRALWSYGPGYLLGLSLCALQGFFEHQSGRVRGTRGRVVPAGISYYGRAYNVLWLNDGFHREHHRFPGAHWSLLPRHQRDLEREEDFDPAGTSRAPPVLRWTEDLLRIANRTQAEVLDTLERASLRSKRLQRFMIRRHRQAMAALLPLLPPKSAGEGPMTVCVVGGGIFPRTLLVLRELLPLARVTILDLRDENLEHAKSHLRKQSIETGQVRFRHERFDPRDNGDFDLVIIPLGYRGDRADLYRRRSGPPVLVHDWIWQRQRRAAHGATISWVLLKRLNLILPALGAKG